MRPPARVLPSGPSNRTPGAHTRTESAIVLPAFVACPTLHCYDAVVDCSESFHIVNVPINGGTPCAFLRLLRSSVYLAAQLPTPTYAAISAATALTSSRISERIQTATSGTTGARRGTSIPTPGRPAQLIRTPAAHMERITSTDT